MLLMIMAASVWKGAFEIHCKYMLALGYCGLNDTSHAQRYLDEAEKLDPNHLGIYQIKAVCDGFQN